MVDRFSAINKCGFPACSWCFASKQGCDRRTPSCGTCLRRGLKCVYRPVPCGRPALPANRPNKAKQYVQSLRAPINIKSRGRADGFGENVFTRVNQRSQRSRALMTSKTLDRIQKRPKMLNTYQGCGVALPPKKKAIVVKKRRPAAPAPVPVELPVPAIVRKQRPMAPPVPSISALENLLRSGKLQSNVARIGGYNYNVYRVVNQSLWATQTDDTGFSYRYIPSTDLVEFHPWGAAPQSLVETVSDITGSGYVDRNYIRWGPNNDEFMLRSRRPRSGWVEVVNRYLLPDGIRPKEDTRVLIVDEKEYRVSYWELKKYPRAFVNEYPTGIYGLLRPGDFAPESRIVEDLGNIMYNVYTGGVDTTAFDWNDDEGFTALDAFG